MRELLLPEAELRLRQGGGLQIMPDKETGGRIANPARLKLLFMQHDREIAKRYGCAAARRQDDG